MYINYQQIGVWHRTTSTHCDSLEWCRLVRMVTAGMMALKFDVMGFWKLVTFGEEEFPFMRARQFVLDNYSFAVQLTIAYIIAIFSIKYIMQSRDPFQLTNPLRVWNLILSIFSIVGTIRMMPFMIQQFMTIGLTKTNCSSGLSTLPDYAEYWLFLTIISKFAEFVDTIFLVLRKKPLIFLHWYHHVTTCLFFALAYTTPSSQTRVGAITNMFVHAVMYPYYFARSCNINVNKKVSMLVTVLQLAQFLFFIYGCSTLYYKLMIGKFDCDTPVYILHATAWISITYLMLFANFFYHTYFGAKIKKKGE